MFGTIRQTLREKTTRATETEFYKVTLMPTLRVQVLGIKNKYMTDRSVKDELLRSVMGCTRADTEIIQGI